METFKPLELMEKKYSVKLEDSVCNGDNGKIFLVDNGKLVKIPYNPFNGQLCNDRCSQFNLYKACNKQKLAIELGIRYPDVEGIFAVKEETSGRYYPGLVMRNLNGGRTFDQLSWEELKEARKKRDLEIEKARDLGLIVKDNHKNNSMWYNDESYLLDADDVEIMNEFN